MILPSFLQGAHPSPLTAGGCLGSLEEPTSEDKMRPRPVIRMRDKQSRAESPAGQAGCLWDQVPRRK